MDVHCEFWLLAVSCAYVNAVPSQRLKNCAGSRSGSSSARSGLLHVAPTRHEVLPPKHVSGHEPEPVPSVNRSTLHPKLTACSSGFWHVHVIGTV